MKLTSFEYEERSNGQTTWKTVPTPLGQVNLFVGRNGTGKSRLLNTMSSLALILEGILRVTSGESTFHAVLTDEANSYDITISFNKGEVEFEQLQINGDTRLRRQKDGSGYAFSTELAKSLDFRIPTSSIALITRRDAVQHPYLEPLYSWAEVSRRYYFGSDMGKHNAYAALPNFTDEEVDLGILQNDVTEYAQVTKIYSFGFKRYGSQFDAAILRDMREIGYNCSDVGVMQLAEAQALGAVPWIIYVQEVDLDFPTRQIEMSVGMFRALASIIFLNFNGFSGRRGTLFFDDIGEGLDYARSSALIKLLVDRASAEGFQLVLTTNDQFVMNQVDLRNWHIIDREGMRLSFRDFSNNAEEFEKYEFIGLSNFDFFRREVA